MISIADSSLDLRAAVHLYHLLRSLSGFDKDFTASGEKKESHYRIQYQVIIKHVHLVKLCQTFLGKVCYSATGAPEKGGDANTMLDELLQGLLRKAPLKMIKEQITKVSHEVGNLNEKDGKLKIYPNFYKYEYQPIEMIPD